MGDDTQDSEHPDEIPEEEADDEETAEYRPLFPEGADSPTSAEQWQEVFAAEKGGE
jgi:hypothetical protein